MILFSGAEREGREGVLICDFASVSAKEQRASDFGMRRFGKTNSFLSIVLSSGQTRRVVAWRGMVRVVLFAHCNYQFNKKMRVLFCCCDLEFKKTNKETSGGWLLKEV
jgi:hypothetical protein